MICDIEKGRVKSPSLEITEKLAKALQTSPIYFTETKAATPFAIKELERVLPDSLKKALLQVEFLPYLMLAQKAFEQKIPPHVIDTFIESIKTVMKNPPKR